MGEGLLRNVPFEQSFHLVNGRNLKNLHELANALVSMDEKTFSHHVTKDRNDFSNWIKGVFREEELADQISRIRSREGISRRLSEALKAESKKTPPQRVEPPKTEQKRASAIDAIRKLIPQRARKEPLLIEQKDASANAEISRKLGLIKQKEEEIAAREKKLLGMKGNQDQSPQPKQDHAFFSGEFVNGFLIGFLLAVVAMLLYVKLAA